jgi:hypothetical protein
MCGRHGFPAPPAPESAFLVMADILEKTCNFPRLVNDAFSMQSAVASAFQG